MSTAAALVIPQTWTAVMEALFEESWNPDLDRFRSPYAFRGHPIFADPLITSLIRLGGQYADVEDDLLRNFRKYAHREFSSSDSIVWCVNYIKTHALLPGRLRDILKRHGSDMVTASGAPEGQPKVEGAAGARLSLAVC